MKIVVLVKQVPSVSDIELDPKTNNLVRIGAPSMLNPVDMHAIEAALAVKDAAGGTVTLVSMGMATACRCHARRRCHGGRRRRACFGRTNGRFRYVGNR
ncbi:hypothetical protein [Colibacter massiliensis]|uniref:hypothetical protein n=1 Tax=Colibacter massiliensis TaxID=1852379 RepID=UPI0023573943|nr:hypothetical protein [Colibacter massiliensis]